MSKINVKASCVTAEYDLSKGIPELKLIDGKQVLVGTMELSKQIDLSKENAQQEKISAIDVETKAPVEVVNNIGKDVVAEEKEEKKEEKKKEEPEDEMLQW